jgi:hypothetical protein
VGHGRTLSAVALDCHRAAATKKSPAERRERQG